MLKTLKIVSSIIISSLILSSPAMSYSPFLDQSYDMYSVRGKCEMCHTGTKLNQFGNDFELQWRQSKDVVKAFLAVENKDSDGDGFSNVIEIKSMSLPGDKVSTPQMPQAYVPDLFRISKQ